MRRAFRLSKENTLAESESRGSRIAGIIGGIIGVLVVLGGCLGGGISFLLEAHQETCQQLQQEANDDISTAAKTGDRIKAEQSARIVLANQGCFHREVVETVIQDFPDIAATYFPAPNPS